MRKFNKITHLVRNIIEGRRKSYVFLVAAIFCAVFFSAFALMVTYGAITSIQDSYSSLLMKSNAVLSDSERVFMETELGDIAYKIGNTTFVSNISMFESEKTMAQNILYVIVTLVLLFFSMSVIMINNSVSAHIRSKASMIGTMRAVGATQSDVRKMFVWQLVYMIVAGIIVGAVVSLCVYLFIAITNPTTLRSTNAILVALALIGYCAALFVICAYNIHKKAKQYLKRSIVATIREL